MQGSDKEDTPTTTMACRKCRAACPASFRFCDQCGLRLQKPSKPTLGPVKQLKRKLPKKTGVPRSWFWGQQPDNNNEAGMLGSDVAEPRIEEKSPPGLPCSPNKRGEKTAWFWGSTMPSTVDGTPVQFT
ncbi:Aste57867_20646 [Aphanomyces stellatus]|uniref:Aste57867_20646 protein n=1 Tax=Aphanomyces stellatus TaxID=120398 RepID=A0A485LG54_9STRA|nr:hypothetical protein As57867_020578 [Aphanomyces stellatus]VFT97326.1 Aste57867_20646 [Aphanomyces stellatus]